jgi:hypothetical protein
MDKVCILGLQVWEFAWISGVRATRHGGCAQIRAATRVSSVLLGELQAFLGGVQCAGLLFQEHFA